MPGSRARGHSPPVRERPWATSHRGALAQEGPADPGLGWTYQGKDDPRGGLDALSAATFVTSSFPDYLSGHSTFSAAAAMLLKAATGSDTFGMSVSIWPATPALSQTDTQPGVPAAPVTLSWKSFTAAADQAGISRQYGGIHFDPYQATVRPTAKAYWPRWRGSGTPTGHHDYFNCSGPRIVNSAELLAACLHPGRFGGHLARYPDAVRRVDANLEASHWDR